MPKPRTARVAGPLIASVVVLLFALPVGWFLAYFMNDDVRTADHVVFVAVPLVELVVAGLVAGLVIGRAPDVRPGRAMAGALALVSVPATVVTAGYALLSLTPLFDDAIGRSAGDGVWAVVAAVSVAASVGLAVVGSRLVAATAATSGSGRQTTPA